MFGDNPNQPPPRPPEAAASPTVDHQLREREDVQLQRLKDEYLDIAGRIGDGATLTPAELDRVAELRTRLGITRPLHVDAEAVAERARLYAASRAADDAATALAPERARIDSIRAEKARLRAQIDQLEAQERALHSEIQAIELKLQGAEVELSRARRAEIDHHFRHTQLFQSAADDRRYPNSVTIRSAT